MLAERAQSFFVSRLKPSLETSDHQDLNKVASLSDVNVYDGCVFKVVFVLMKIQSQVIEVKLARLRHDRNPCCLTVAKLNSKASLASLNDIFSQFGRIRSAHIRSSVGGRLIHFAEIIFDRRMDAIEAMDHYNVHPGNPAAICNENFVQGIYLAHGKLLLANLGSEITLHHIIDLFSEFGEILAASVDHDQSGKSVGTAFVVLKQWPDAVKAMKKYNGASIDRRPLRIELTTLEPGLDSKPTAKLVLANLDSSVSFADIYELFSKIGKLQGAAVHFSRSGKPLGTAEVIFESRRYATEAMKQCNGFALKGRPLQIQFAASRSVLSGPVKALIAGLDHNVLLQDLNKIFSRFGKLRAVAISRGFDESKAEVVFDQRPDAVRALQQCHGAPLKGRPLQVQLAASDGNSDDMPKSRMVPRVPIGRIANGRVARLTHRGVLQAKPFRGVLGWTRCGKRKRINKRNLLTHYGLDAYLNSR